MFSWKYLNPMLLLRWYDAQLDIAIADTVELFTRKKAKQLKRDIAVLNVDFDTRILEHDHTAYGRWYAKMVQVLHARKAEAAERILDQFREPYDLVKQGKLTDLGWWYVEQAAPVLSPNHPSLRHNY